MNFSRTMIGDITVVKVELVEASLNQSEDFKDFLIESSTESHPKMVVDLGNVLYMDSSFIGALVVGLKKVLSKNGEIALANISEDVMALFEITRMDQVFKIYKSTEEAVNSLN